MGIRVKLLAKLIDKEVDLEKPDRILRVDLIGKYAGISFIVRSDVFSVTRCACVTRMLLRKRSKTAS